MTQPYPFVVNLIPKRRIRRRAAIVAVRRWSIAILVTALAVALPANALALHQRAAAIPAKSSVVSVTSELDTVRSAIPDLKARQNELDRQRAEQRLADSRVDWHSFLTLLAPHIPDNAHLETFTASIQRVDFKAPVVVGDIINFRTRTHSCGTTSVTICVAVQAERWSTAETIDVTHATITMVAVDETGKPVPFRTHPTPADGVR